jgi:hypothetical protein
MSAMQPIQIRNVLKSRINRSFFDFGRREFSRDELVDLASQNETLLEEVLSEWERAGFLKRSKDDPFDITILGPVDVDIPGWPYSDRSGSGSS